jgi:Undecaprenyl-phosphate glucose phosphotransferase
MRLGNSVLILLFLVIDLAVLLLAYLIQSWFHYHDWPPFDELSIVLPLTWSVTYVYFIDRGFFDIQDLVGRIRHLLRKFFVFVLLTSIIIILFDLDDISRAMLFGTILWFLVLKYPLSHFYTYLVTIRTDSPSNNKILVVGAGKIGLAMEKYFKMRPSMGGVIGFLDNSPEVSGKVKWLGRLSDFQRVYDETPFDEVIITINLKNEADIKSIVNVAEYNGVRPTVVANYYSLFNRNFEIRNLAGIPLVSIREVPLDSYVARLWKRTFDIAFSSVALLLLAPLLFAIALAIKIDSRGPVFYRPVRMGRRGSRITILKFRSMVHNPKGSDPSRSTARNDERITRVGRFIRKYSMDELPQFFNVFIGQMSVVGPRPHRIDLNKRFQQTAQNYLVRHYIKPGITGWAQVNGWRGPTESRYQYIARTLHDLWYIEHWSMALDVYIVLLTIFGRNTRRNAF